ncbi:MAG: hypothetical protein OEU92_19540, partial [Alphaproteobacteria bacterium]|nr:hypothetical protein [Alphaproteobacteria bacterium]
MFGRHLGRQLTSPMLAAFLGLAFAGALPGVAFGQAWELEREQGVGGGSGGAPTKVAANQAGKKVGVRIIIHSDDKPVIRAAEGEPVSPFAPVSPTADETTPRAEAPAAVVDVRANPPTAAELLKGPIRKPIETTALAALPVIDQTARSA